MKITRYENREEWLEARKGKVMGSKLKDIIVKRGTGKKIGFYKLIAERLAVEEDGNETPMERGTRLEPEAMARFITETGKKVDTSLIICERDDNSDIAFSPDGLIGRTEAVEVKCLASANHLEAYLTQVVPDEYEFQVLQYFIVNEQLKKLNVVFYDPRVACKDFFVIVIAREQVQADVDTYLEYEKNILMEVDTVVRKLAF